MQFSKKSLIDLLKKMRILFALLAKCSFEMAALRLIVGGGGPLAPYS